MNPKPPKQTGTTHPLPIEVDSYNRVEPRGGSKPHAPIVRRQTKHELNPDYYTLTVDGTLLAQIVATADTTVFVSLGGDIIPLSRNQTEYWFLNDDALDKPLSHATELTFTAVRIPETSITDPLVLDPSLSGPPFRSTEDPPWSSRILAPTTGDSYIFRGTPSEPSGTDVALYVLLNVMTGSVPGTRSLANVQWYLTGTAPPAGGSLQPGSRPYASVNALPHEEYVAASLPFTSF